VGAIWRMFFFSIAEGNQHFIQPGAVVVL